MHTLNSSAIRGVDYDESTQNMTIYFRSSGGYTFYGVPWEVYTGLINSGSPGSYYNYHIRGRYR